MLCGQKSNNHGRLPKNHGMAYFPQTKQVTPRENPLQALRVTRTYKTTPLEDDIEHLQIRRRGAMAYAMMACHCVRHGLLWHMSMSMSLAVFPREEKAVDTAHMRYHTNGDPAEVYLRQTETFREPVCGRRSSH